MKKRTIYTLIIIFILIGFAATVTIDWLYDTFGHLTMDEIIFHIKVPMEGTNTDLVFTFMKKCIWKVILPTAIISLILIYPMVKDLKFIHKINTSERRRTVVVNFGIAILILLICVCRVFIVTDIIGYIGKKIDVSTFIEEQYVDPKQANIQFGENKRNLIYIFLESMETTYYSKEEGGLSEHNLTPEIYQLVKENINFSNSEKIVGAHTLYGTTWTVGAMTAQTAGLPLKIGIGQNSLSEYSVFLEGAYSIGQILKNNGYHNYLLLGSDAKFGGRKNLFEQHGEYEIWDFESAKAENRITEKVWWGYEDNKLFEYAKEKILNLAKEDQPFNFTMLTADTHFSDGYKCEDCPNKWDQQYKNVISCSSKKVGQFIEWIKQQEFYENTTIVIVGDHLTMQSNFFDLQEGQEYDKTVISCIINSAIGKEQTKNRKYSTMDLYPTTLAALGATIEGNKLALGTNLFSEEQTLIEKYGLEYVENELKKTSEFYDNNILILNSERK